MLLRIFATWRARVLAILIILFIGLAVTLTNLPREADRIAFEHKLEVRVIGDTEQKILKVPVDATVLGGKVYVVDAGLPGVKVFSGEGKELFEFRGIRYHDIKGAELKYPSAITVGPTGMIYVADLTGAKIVVFDENGIAKKVINIPKEGERPAKPLSMTFDLLGHLYVGEGEIGKIMIFSDDKFLREFAVGKLDHPNGIAVDSKRRIFVSDSNNRRIIVYDQNGRPEREWRLRDKKSFVPRDIVFDGSGRLVVADMLNSRIVFLNDEGEQTKQLMRLPNMDQLFLPSGLEIDKHNNLVIVDRGLSQVFVLQVP